MGSRSGFGRRLTASPGLTAAGASTIPPTGVTRSPEPKVESDRGSPTETPNLNLNPEILAAALQGLEAQRARLESHIAEVSRLLSARTQGPAAVAKTPRPRRKLSAAGGRRIAAATKKRWAEYHRKKAEAAQKTDEPAAVKKAAPKKTAATAATQPAAAGASE